MCNKKKYQIAALMSALALINANIAESAYADDLAQRKWTKEHVRSLIGQSTNFPMSDEAEKDFGILKNDVDTVSNYLIEIFEEDSFGLTMCNALYLMSNTKNNHELFSNAISNKLALFTNGTDSDMDYLKWGAARAFARMKQSRENAADANTSSEKNNFTQETIAPRDKIFLHTNAVLAAPTVEPNMPEVFAQIEAINSASSAKRSVWLWLLALPVAVGIVWRVCRKKEDSHVK